MKKPSLFLLLLIGIVPASAQTSDEEAIKRIIQQETNSYEAGNHGAWSNFWAHEPYVVWVFNQPDGGYQKVTGWNELSNQMKELMRADSGSSPRPPAQRANYVIRQNGTMAFASFEQFRTGSPIRTKENRVLEKKGNDWKLIHSSTFIPWNEVKAGTSVRTNGEFRRGTYAVTNGRDKLAATFDDDGKYAINLNGTLAVTGTYTITGDTVEVTDVDGPRSCKGTSGKYKWALDGKSLTFIKLDDVCAGRVNGLTRQAWTQE